MDIRIVHTCNNNCLYCLEQSLRKRSPYINKQEIYFEIDRDSSEVLSIYWGNPLLHPDVYDIVSYAQKKWYTSINILTNTFWLSQEVLQKLIESWITGIHFYFNSFDSEIHASIVNTGISLKELIRNINTIRNSGLSYKVIIHINWKNIFSLYKDIFILYTRFWVRNFEFVNYFPFDRPFDLYDAELSYDIDEYREVIDKLFRLLQKINVSAKFNKFSPDFFWKFDVYYDFEHGILDQIGPEDEQRLEDEIPWCYEKKRCKSCFIKDNCHIYERNHWSTASKGLKGM